MKRFDGDQLGTALHELRPRPTERFAVELDERVAAGFPRRGRESSSPPARLRAWLLESKPRRLLLPAAGVALTAIAVATVLVIAGEPGGEGKRPESGGNLLSSTQSFDGSANFATPDRAAPGRLLEPNPFSNSNPSDKSNGRAPGPAEATETESAAGSTNYNETSRPTQAIAGTGTEASADAHQRKVERSAEIVIGTKPGEVGAASSKVFQAVHAYDGIVLNSSTRDDSGAGAEANFELLIPSARLGDAMAAFSRIGVVRLRHEATQDITAPTVGTEEKLADSRARIDSLLAQLREASEAGERELVEAELRSERRRAAHLQGQLDQLGKRASTSRVAVRVESGRGALSPAGPGDGKWGVDDALHSAGRVLTVAAGVAIVGAAVLAPIALLLALAWLVGRAWTRRARERALT